MKSVLEGDEQMSFHIRELKNEDWDSIKHIYLEGIKTGKATFQTDAPTQEEWFAGHILPCSIGYFEAGMMLGWASLSPVSSRCVYSGVAEVSIYVKEEARGKGVGRKLMESLIELSEENGYWTLQSGIFPENSSSISLHQAHGFREVGKREKMGKLKNEWKDVLLFERRSTRVGID